MSVVPPETTPVPVPIEQPASDDSGNSSISQIALILGLSSVFGLFVLLVLFFLWRKHVRGRPGFEERKLQRKQGISVIACRIRTTLGSVVNTLGRSHHHESTGHLAHGSGSQQGHGHRHDQGDTESQHDILEAKDCVRKSNSRTPLTGLLSDDTYDPSVVEDSKPRPVSSTEINTSGRGESRIGIDTIQLSNQPHAPKLSNQLPALKRPSGPCFRPSSDMLPPRLCKTYVWQPEPSPLSPRHPDLESESLSSPTSEERSSKSFRLGWDEDEAASPQSPSK
ncbi:hypothetical protein DFJ77DRAFT_220927 [Powellomyces hirtus]|nr:hypothetical protein DFJ77DRAFT_220927 [Powellomyces hirtus]